MHRFLGLLTVGGSTFQGGWLSYGGLHESSGPPGVAASQCSLADHQCCPAAGVCLLTLCTASTQTSCIFR